MSLIGHKRNDDRPQFHWNDKANIHQFRESKGRSVPCRFLLRRNIRRDPFGGRRERLRKKARKLRKPGCNRWSFFDWSSPVRIPSYAKRACHCFGGGEDNLFSVFIPLLDHILSTTRFMTRTLLHSISETVLSRAEEMLSKSPSMRWLISITEVHFGTHVSTTKTKALFHCWELLWNFFSNKYSCKNLKQFFWSQNNDGGKKYSLLHVTIFSFTLIYVVICVTFSYISFTCCF